MPSTISEAIKFLETQWSSINDNKINGILAEIRLKNFLTANKIHYVTGGWILSPGNSEHVDIPAREKICVLPRAHPFTWEGSSSQSLKPFTPAEISAYAYFRQLGIKTVFAQPLAIHEHLYNCPTPANSSKRASYPKPYALGFLEISSTGSPTSVAEDQIFEKFPARKGNTGLRCYKTGRITATDLRWAKLNKNELSATISDLFWFEYSRYYLNIARLMSSNDLDLFIIGESGRQYPVEIKSKSPAFDKSLKQWFGIDIGPFAKLSFFTSNAMNNDALYIVEEVSATREHIEWYGIRFSALVASCSWVGQAGGRSMTGGASSTFKVPKLAFKPLKELILDL